MWRVAWPEGTAMGFKDFTTEQQARTYEAQIRETRGSKTGVEITYPIWVHVS